MVSFEYDVLASSLSFSISRRQTSFTLISIKEYVSSTFGVSWINVWPLVGLSICEYVVSVSVACEPSFSDVMASLSLCTRVPLLPLFLSPHLSSSAFRLFNLQRWNCFVVGERQVKIWVTNLFVRPRSLHAKFCLFHKKSVNRKPFLVQLIFFHQPKKKLQKFKDTVDNMRPTFFVRRQNPLFFDSYPLGHHISQIWPILEFF